MTGNRRHTWFGVTIVLPVLALVLSLGMLPQAVIAEAEEAYREWVCSARPYVGLEPSETDDEASAAQTPLDGEIPDPSMLSVNDPLTEANLYALLDKYDSDGAWILRHAEGLDGYSWRDWLSGCSTLGDASGMIGTAVHEQLHAFTSSKGWYSRAIYVGKGKYITCPVTDVFDTLECTQDMPASLQTSRYDTYVGPAADYYMDSRQNGVYGLMNEYAAYYWGKNTNGRLESFYGYHDNSNEYVAFQEFRHYILRYMVYAREHHPSVYQGIMGNEEFRRAFKQVDDGFEAIVKTYRSTHYLYGGFESEYLALEAENSKPVYREMLALLKGFPDVPGNHWAYEVINRAVKLGIMKGYENGNFGPEDNVTRGQVAVILWNMAGKPPVGPSAKAFSDVKDGAYYYGAVRWAASVGVVSGYAGTGRFGPDDNVTREQLAVMLANYAAKVGYLEVAGSPSDYAGMSDAGKVSGYAQKAVGWCFRNKILSGSHGQVMPQGNATRAQVAKMAVFLYDMLY